MDSVRLSTEVVTRNKPLELSQSALGFGLDGTTFDRKGSLRSHQVAPRAFASKPRNGALPATYSPGKRNKKQFLSPK